MAIAQCHLVVIFHERYTSASEALLVLIGQFTKRVFVVCLQGTSGSCHDELAQTGHQYRFGGK
jgi:hypothetical protein